jgi:hypothetical protein
VRKKRVILLCLIGTALALIAFLALKPQPKEPSYDGYPLSYWVAILGNSGGYYPGLRAFATGDLNPSDEMATNAISHIGVAALPFLMNWIHYQPARFGSWTLLAKLLRSPSPPARKLGSRLWNWTVDAKALQLANGAPLAFDALRTRAMPVFGDLCRFLNDTNRPWTASRAATALGFLGTNALPQLRAVAADASHPARSDAAIAITEIQTRENALSNASTQ